MLRASTIFSSTNRMNGGTVMERPPFLALAWAGLAACATWRDLVSGLTLGGVKG